MDCKVIALDPGETTGYFVKRYPENCHRLTEGIVVEGGTVGRNHLEVFNLLDRVAPDVVILETFALYPGKAKSLSWNSFYPCEVIGVIKLWLMLHPEVIKVEQAPSVKKYAGGLREDFQYFQHYLLKEHMSEHVKDAYMHIKYWEWIGKGW